MSKAGRLQSSLGPSAAERAERVERELCMPSTGAHLLRLLPEFRGLLHRTDVRADLHQDNQTHVSCSKLQPNISIQFDAILWMCCGENVSS